MHDEKTKRRSQTHSSASGEYLFHITILLAANLAITLAWDPDALTTSLTQAIILTTTIVVLTCGTVQTFRPWWGHHDRQSCVACLRITATSPESLSGSLRMHHRVNRIHILVPLILVGCLPLTIRWVFGDEHPWDYWSSATSSISFLLFYLKERFSWVHRLRQDHCSACLDDEEITT